MAAGNGRGGRRRRVLNDGVRAASAAAEAELANSDPVADGARMRRFAPPEGSVSFAVARGLLPTSGLRLASVALGGTATVAALLAGHYYSAMLPASLAPVLALSSPTALASWLTTTLMLTIAALCVAIYGLRSNRTDDVRGRYRWWMSAACACLAANAIYATRLHVIAAETLAQVTGFAPLGGALWWIAPAAVGALAIGFRPLGDLRESKLSLSFVVLSVLALGASACGSAGLLPGVAAPFSTLIAFGGLLVGLVFAIVAQLSYVRRVLQETDGAVPAPVKKTAVKKDAAKKGEVKQEAAGTAPEPAKSRAKPRTKPASESRAKPQSKSKAKPEKQPQELKVAQETQWTDGSEVLDGDYEDDQPRRKLTKAERKRLRKQKAGRYAA